MERRKSNESFPLQIFGLIKELKIFLQSVHEKQDVFGIFTDWFRKEFDLPVASVLDVKTNVELSNLGPKAFAKEGVFAGDDSSIGDRTVGESFAVCCPGLTSNFLFLKS